MKRPPSVCASTRVLPILKLLVNLKVSWRKEIGRENYESAQAKRVSGRVSTHRKVTLPQISDIRCENRLAQKIPVVTSFEKRIVSPPVESTSLSNVDTVDAADTIRSEGVSWAGLSRCNDPYDFSAAGAVSVADERGWTSSVSMAKIPSVSLTNAESNYL